MDRPYKTITLESPSGFSIVLEHHHEHHMGAETVELVPSAPLHGVHRFRTTNGWAFYDASTDRVFLYDACLILEVDPHTLLCRHCSPPEPWYISEFSRNGDNFRLSLYDGSGGRDEQQIPFHQISWLEGLGAAISGRFPSAYP